MGIGDFVSSDDDRLDKILKFTAEIDKMTAVMRRTLLLDKSRRENDAEHSWHIAVMAMMFEEYFYAKVDIGRAVQMCIVHDLVEIYAGDTFAFDEKGHEDKFEREMKAADRLFGQLPDPIGQTMRSFWEEFDAMETDDARYAACMDRIQPLFHNTLTDGHTWVQGQATRQAVEKREDPIRLYMPRVYEWIEKNIDNGIAKGWIKDTGEKS